MLAHAMGVLKEAFNLPMIPVRSERIAMIGSFS
jgi:hypothetical protein